MIPLSRGRRTRALRSPERSRRGLAIALAAAFAFCSPGPAAQTDDLRIWSINSQTVAVKNAIRLDVRPPFHGVNDFERRYRIRLDNPALAATWIGGSGQLTLRGRLRGVTTATVSVPDNFGGTALASFRLRVTGPALVPFVPSAADPLREGIVRIVNHDAEAGEIEITATDDSGMEARPVLLVIPGGAVAQFNSTDLEAGSPEKGLTGGTGPGQGDWRLVLRSSLDFEVLSYLRTGDGLLTPMHDVLRRVDGFYRLSMFNPASNLNQASFLRFVNPTQRSDAAAWLWATDDTGAMPGRGVVVEVAPGQSRTVSAAELESGTGLIGEIGDGQGRWRMDLVIEPPLVAMNLLESPGGHLRNLSRVPPTVPDDADAVHLVRFFPGAGNPHGWQGVVRVINRSRVAGTVGIIPVDESGSEYGPLFFRVEAGGAVHLDADDIEFGNTGKGLRGSTGVGIGDWRLRFFSALDFEVLAFVRTPDGALTSMHELVPSIRNEFWVPAFNPGGDAGPASMLRLVNLTRREARVTVRATRDSGLRRNAVVVLAIAPRMHHVLTAADLEAARESASGVSGGGTGSWRLRVTSDEPIVAMNLLSSPTGHLTNLSTAPDRSGR